MFQQLGYKSPSLSSQSSQTCDDFYSSVKNDKATPTNFLWTLLWGHPIIWHYAVDPQMGQAVGKTDVYADQGNVVGNP